MNFANSWLRDEEGMTTVEYALILALVVAGTLIIWSTVGQFAAGQSENVNKSVF